MTAISNIQTKGVKDNNHLSSPAKRDNGSLFAHARNLAQADMLLKGTDQYGKWKSLRQKNDKALTASLAQKIIDRHEMLEHARKNGGGLDAQKFDALTKSIARQGIFLFTSGQLKKSLRFSKHRADSSRLPEADMPLAKSHAPVVKPHVPAPKSHVPVSKRQTPEPIIQMNLPAKKTENFQAGTDEMVVDVVCGKYNLSPAMIALGNEEKVMLPLGELARILEFNISSNPGTGKAQGWFLSEDRTFFLDAVSGKGTIQGKPISVDPEDIVTTKDGIYVDGKTLSKWFPIDVTYDFSRQSVSVNPREELPFQTRAARHLSWQNRLKVSRKTPQFPRRYPEYELFEAPVVDMGVSGNYQKTAKDSQDSGGDYYVRARGDLAWMNSELYLSGNEDDPLKTARLTLKKEDPDAELLGAMYATKMAVGDIRVPGFPIVGAGGYERGAKVSNEPVNRAHEYDHTYFEGSLSPGWDVEVYRNDVLLRNQQVGADGRYSFEEIPLYYGTNDFTLKFYGPQGEERQEKKQILVGGDMIKPGQLQYEVSASQKDKTLFGVGESKHARGSGRFLAHYEYGLTPNLSLQGGFLSQEIANDRHTYVHAGARGSVADSYLTGDLVFDLDGGGYAVQALGQKKVGPLDFRARQQFFHDFSTTGNTENIDLLQSRTTLSAFGRIKNGFFVQDIPFSLNFTNTQRESGSETSASADISTSIKNTYLNTSIEWSDQDDADANEADLEGSTHITSEFKGIRLRGSVDYDLHPEKKLTKARFSAVKNLNHDLSAELSVTHDMDQEDEDLTTTSLGANWNNGKWAVSPRVSYDSDDAFSASVMFNTSFGMEPRTGMPVFSSSRSSDKGAVSAQVFHDRNNNQIYDEGDEPIANAKVSALQGHKSAVTDENGIAFIRGLSKNRPTDVALETQTLEDPYWEPSLPGESVLPRPGHVDMIDIPVTATGEIDGTLSVRTPDGAVKELTHAPLQLLNEEDQVVRETKSEYDGFYLFEKVPPGTYYVRLEPEFEESLKTAPLESIPVAISNDGNIVSGVDLAFAPKTFAVPGVPGEKPPVQGIAGTRSHGPDGNAISVESVPEFGAMGEPRELPELAVVPGPKELPELGTVTLESLSASSRMENRDGAESLGETPIEESPMPVPSSDGFLVPRYDSELSYRGRPDQSSSVSAPVSSGSMLSGDYTDYTDDDMETKPVSQPDPVSSANFDSGPGKPQYGTHLASYRTMDKAISGIMHQANKYKNLLSDSDFTIQKADLGPEKGSLYRVIAGTSAQEQPARELGKSIRKMTPYTRIVSLDHSSQKGVHLSSFRSMEGARQGIKRLQAAHPEALKDVPFSIVYKDLGPEKGAWYRVVAGNFFQEDQAKKLSEKIRHKAAYGRPLPLENTSQLAVHAASYPTLERAVKGMRILAKQTRTAPDHMAVRKVDLGEKGVWYRVLIGRFDDETKAQTLASHIQDQGQYAKVVNFG